MPALIDIVRQLIVIREQKESPQAHAALPATYDKPKMPLATFGQGAKHAPLARHQRVEKVMRAPHEVGVKMLLSDRRPMRRMSRMR